MLYELRTYDFRPGDLARYLTLFGERGLGLISRHLTLAGYWYAETGVLNRAYHLWSYQNAQDRFDRRTALYADRDWVDGFIPHALPLILVQRGELLAPLPGYGADTSALARAGRLERPPRVFELQTLKVAVSYIARLENSFLESGPVIHEHPENVGSWRSLTGVLGRVRHLWAYQDEADREARHRSLLRDDRLSWTRQDTLEVESEILRPAGFSPIG